GARRGGGGPGGSPPRSARRPSPRAAPATSTLLYPSPTRSLLPRPRPDTAPPTSFLRSHRLARCGAGPARLRVLVSPRAPSAPVQAEIVAHPGRPGTGARRAVDTAPGRFSQRLRAPCPHHLPLAAAQTQPSG